MVKHWMRWCRLCAREDPSNTHVNVFYEDEKGQALSDTLNKCFSIDINHFNDWPHMICVHCYFVAKSIVNMAQRTSKVQAMFAELLDGEEDLDADKVKERYDLHRNSDIKFDLKLPIIGKTAVNDLEIPMEMNEEMVDVDELQYIDSDVLTTTAIKTEKSDEDYLPEQSDRMPTQHEKSSSDYNESLKSEVLSEDLSLEEKPLKCAIKTEESVEDYLAEQSDRMPTQLEKSSSDDNESLKVEVVSEDLSLEEKPLKCAIKTEESVEDYLPEQSDRMPTQHDKSSSDDNESLKSEVVSEDPLKCAHCDKLFKNKYTLQVHEDIHNETKYICVICGLKLNTQRTLRTHMVVHSDQKQHKFDYCGNEYKRAKALKNHLILHTGLKPYTCDFCDRTFANGSNCRSHKKKSHPVELAAMEAAGKNSILAGIPKLEDLRAKLNKSPKTSAERGREFRARKALLKQQSKQQQEPDAIVEIAIEDTRSSGPSEDNQVPGPFEMRTLEKRARCAEATRRWREKKKGVSESSKKQVKTAAQRMREYRERKRLAKKMLLKQQSD